MQELPGEHANEEGIMVLCAVCVQRLPDDARMCRQHLGGPGRTWAASNRIMCDFSHRGVTPSRLPAGDRADDLARHSAAA